MRKKIKGLIFIGLGIIVLLIYVIGIIKDVGLGGGLWITILSIWLIYEGIRIRNSKKSILFNFQDINWR